MCLRIRLKISVSSDYWMCWIDLFFLLLTMNNQFIIEVFPLRPFFLLAGSILCSKSPSMVSHLSPSRGSLTRSLLLLATPLLSTSMHSFSRESDCCCSTKAPHWIDFPLYLCFRSVHKPRRTYEKISFFSCSVYLQEFDVERQDCF